MQSIRRFPTISVNHSLRLTPGPRRGPADGGAMLEYFPCVMWFRSGFEWELNQNPKGSAGPRHYGKATSVGQCQHLPAARVLLTPYLERVVVLQPASTSSAQNWQRFRAHICPPASQPSQQGVEMPHSTFEMLPPWKFPRSARKEEDHSKALQPQKSSMSHPSMGTIISISKNCIKQASTEPQSLTKGDGGVQTPSLLRNRAKIPKFKGS